MFELIDESSEIVISLVCSGCNKHCRTLLFPPAKLGLLNDSFCFWAESSRCDELFLCRPLYMPRGGDIDNRWDGVLGTCLCVNDGVKLRQFFVEGSRSSSASSSSGRVYCISTLYLSLRSLGTTFTCCLFFSSSRFYKNGLLSSSVAVGRLSGSLSMHFEINSSISASSMRAKDYGFNPAFTLR